MNRMQGKVCVITGSNRGIGHGIGLRLLEEGARVTFADISPEIHETVAKINQPENCMPCQVDVSERKQITEMLEATVARFGTIDVMFNNAGIVKATNFLETTEDNWNMIMRVNGLGVLLGIQEAAKQFIKLGKPGKIINTGSISSREGSAHNASYCASKFAVVALTQSAARALAQYKITVNGFGPGLVATELWREHDLNLVSLGAGEKPGDAMKKLSSRILLGYAAQAKDIAGTALFLASSDSDYMTGQMLMIDGGMVLI